MAASVLQPVRIAEEQDSVRTHSESSDVGAPTAKISAENNLAVNLSVAAIVPAANVAAREIATNTSGALNSLLNSEQMVRTAVNEAATALTDLTSNSAPASNWRHGVALSDEAAKAAKAAALLDEAAPTSSLFNKARAVNFLRSLGTAGYEILRAVSSAHPAVLTQILIDAENCYKSHRHDIRTAVNTLLGRPQEVTTSTPVTLPLPTRVDRLLERGGHTEPLYAPGVPEKPPLIDPTEEAERWFPMHDEQHQHAIVGLDVPGENQTDSFIDPGTEEGAEGLWAQSRRYAERNPEKDLPRGVKLLFNNNAASSKFRPGAFDEISTCKAWFLDINGTFECLRSLFCYIDRAWSSNRPNARSKAEQPQKIIFDAVLEAIKGWLPQASHEVRETVRRYGDYYKNYHPSRSNWDIGGLQRDFSNELLRALNEAEAREKPPTQQSLWDQIRKMK